MPELITKQITHYTLQKLYYYADDELVEVLSKLTTEERRKIMNHPWCNGRIMVALGKLEPTP